MTHVTSVIVFLALVFFSMTTTPAYASTISSLQTQLISLLTQLISLLTTTSAPVVVPGVVTPPVVATSTSSYTITDVVTVRSQSIDPIPAAADDEYTLYTITLKDASVRQVKVYGFAPVDQTHSGVYQTGYSGDVDALIKLAVVVPVQTGSLIKNVTISNTRLATVVVAAPLPVGSVPAVMGPVLLGTINWGDGGGTNNFFGLAAEAESITLNHTYAAPGTYTITVTDRAGHVATNVVTVL